MEFVCHSIHAPAKRFGLFLNRPGHRVTHDTLNCLVSRALLRPRLDQSSRGKPQCPSTGILQVVRHASRRLLHLLKAATGLTQFSFDNTQLF